MKLHLGCGNDYKNGYINCDISEKIKTDKIIDLEQFLPFEDNSVEEIITNHTLEHIKNFIQLIEEMYRISKNGAIINIKVPYFAYPGSFADPTHVRFLTLKTFEYFTYNNGLNYYSNARFKILKQTLNFSFKKKHKIMNFLINKNQRIYERLFCYIFPSAELNVILEVIK